MTLFSRHPDDPSVMSVGLGAFDGDPGVRPSRRPFVAYAAVREPIPDDGLPRFDQSSHADERSSDTRPGLSRSPRSARGAS